MANSTPWQKGTGKFVIRAGYGEERELMHVCCIGDHGEDEDR